MRRTHLSMLALVLCVLTPVVALAGLYDDDVKNLKSGDLNDRDYWQAKFDIMMLDMAIKQRQPEGRIGLNLVSTIKNLDDLIKKYPNHEELKKWKEHAAEVEKKIDPNASRGESWKPGCPWDESNFVQYWVNVHAAKSAYDAKEMDKSKMYLSNVKQNLEILSRPDRLKDYPEELRKWFDESKAQVEKLDKDLKGK